MAYNKRKKFLEKSGVTSKIVNVEAPMPGKIIDLMVEEGQYVKDGDAVLILEAMKMQNEILSSINGTIRKIYIKPGDIVNKDDILLEIEKE